MASDYRLSQALIARFLGLLLAGVGGVVLLLTAAVALFSLPVTVLTVAFAAALMAALGAALAAILILSREGYVVRLGETGYRVRFVRGAGVKQARWKDVEDVVAGTVAGARCVVLRLTDGRTTTVPVDVLAAEPDAFVKDLQAHLDRGHGYRRIG